MSTRSVRREFSADDDVIAVRSFVFQGRKYKPGDRLDHLGTVERYKVWASMAARCQAPAVPRAAVEVVKLHQDPPTPSAESFHGGIVEAEIAPEPSERVQVMLAELAEIGATEPGPTSDAEDAAGYPEAPTGRRRSRRKAKSENGA